MGNLRKKKYERENKEGEHKERNSWGKIKNWFTTNKLLLGSSNSFNLS